MTTGLWFFVTLLIAQKPYRSVDAYAALEQGKVLAAVSRYDEALALYR